MNLTLRIAKAGLGLLFFAAAQLAMAADRPGLASKALAQRSAAAKVMFEELDKAATGVDFINPVDESNSLRFLYASAMSTGGVAIGDFDGDGKPDIFLVSGPGKNKLFRQVAPMKFEDVTAKAGIDGGDAWGVGCAFADVNGDGKIDIYVCNYLSPNQLFINNGDGTFTEKAKEYGIDFVDACHTPAFCDYDGDGKLDLYILTNRWYRPEGFPNEQTIYIEQGKGPRVLPKYEKFYDAVRTGESTYETQVVGRPDILCHNNGNGTFTDVSKAAGITHRGHGLSATWFDFNGDGKPDIWVGCDFDDADHIYRNNGDGTFTDVTVNTVGHLTWFSMGADFGDVNGDGLMDFFITDMSGTNHFKQKTLMGSMGSKQWFMEHARPPQLMRNSLFLNAGNGRFMEGAYLAGIANSNWSWAARLCDFDNDGKNDIYIQAGMSRNFNEKDDPQALQKDPTKTQWDRYRHLPPLKEQNMAFRNHGDLKFEDVSKAWGLDHLGMSYGCAVGDLDGDGNLDIVSVRLDEPVVIYHNTAQNGHRVTMDFVGTKSNHVGMGVKVRLESESGVQVREMTLTRGYLGCDQPLVHFGLGDDKMIKRLEVRWPSGRSQFYENLEVDQHYTITEPNADAPPIPSNPLPATLFSASPILKEAVHKEAPFNEYVRESLLPNGMSQLGPGHAWGDVDGDGLDDLFIGGGARTNSRKIFLNKGNGKFVESENKFPSDTFCEDLGAVFFDANGDGHLDLFIASGGVEFDAGTPFMQSRLYLNDGKGNFKLAPDSALPTLQDSSGPVVAADYDHDGKVDLFIGGRCVPGKYPTSPKSHLLHNEGGKFIDVTPAELSEIGMVTAALWSDVDGDGWVDLMVAHEWGPIDIYHNDHGKLVKMKDTGLEKYTGWWNGIAGRDLDGDGNIDYVVTNFGRNTKYHPDPAHPALIFYGDMDGTGKSQIIEAEYEGDKIVPIRGRSCSSLAMPFIKEKFTTYKAFASATLPEIYTAKKLESVQKFSAGYLDSGVLHNDGHGHFTFQPLPWAAQLSPSYGVAISELNGDTSPDIVLAQNFFSPQIETGRMASGLSLLLTGNGKGGFDAVWPNRSGISEPGDAKSLTLMDVNGDGLPDVVMGINDAPMSVFLARPEAAAGKVVNVKLAGPKGNAQAYGARVTVVTADGKSQTAEVYAGSGYLSQSPAALTFGLGKEGKAESITVRWPDGKVTTEKSPAVNGNTVTISVPVQ